MEKNVLEMNLTNRDTVGDESQVKISKELRRKIVDDDCRVGESADLTVNVQNEDASIILTKGTTRNTTYDVVDSVPTFKITFEEKTVISLSPSTLCNSLQPATSVCSLETSSSDVGTITGMLGENEGKSPPTTDKKTLTGHILHEISEVLDKMDLSYINKVRSEFKRQLLDNKNVHWEKIKEDKLIKTGPQRGSDRVRRSDGEGERMSSAGKCRVAERNEHTHCPIKRSEAVCRKISNDANATSRGDQNVSPAILEKRCLKIHEDRTGKTCNKVSFIDKVFSAIETFTPGCHIMSHASPADLYSASDTSLDDDSSVSDGDLDAETQSGIAEESSTSSESDSELNYHCSSSRVNEIKTAIEDKLGIPARNYPIALYCFCFALFYLFWTMCYMSCTYRRTFYGVTRNSNTWYCNVYYTFSKLHRVTSDSSEVHVTYKSNRKYYHPFQPW